MRKKTKSNGLTLTIRTCTESGAIYLGVREHLKVARTEVSQEWPLVAIDYAKNGDVVGVECVGAGQVEITTMLRAAKIRPSAALMQSATIMRPDLQEAVA